MSGDKFIIDGNTREIKAPTTELIVAQGDHNSERFLFEMPRIIDENDMSECIARIHYLILDNAGDKQSKGVYTVQDLIAENDKVRFSWVLSQNATGIRGTLSFGIKFIKLNSSDEVVYSWGTGITSVIDIIEGYEHTEDTLELYPDAIEQLKEELRIDCEGKLDKYQGTENSGMFLIVGEDGVVEPHGLSWDTLKKKPFGYFEKDHVVYEGTIEMVSDEEKFIELDPPINACDYNVEFDGVSYALTGKSEGLGLADSGYIGNLSLMNEGYEDTGEPFVLLKLSYLNQNETIVITKTDGTHTLKVMLAESVILKVQSCYLPFANQSLPEVTSENEEQFLQVVNGVPTWVTVGSAEEGDF